MMIVGLGLLTKLINREVKLRAKQGRTLERRLGAWRHEVEKAKWTKPTEIKAIYGTADVIGDNRIVFDICGNSYRLVVKFNYIVGVARILFAGTHPEYDAIDALTVAEDDNDETDQDSDGTQVRS